MDNLRGIFDTGHGLGHAAGDYDPVEEERDIAPPPEIGRDERRMQVRAYNHWAGLLDNRAFPSIEDLDPSSLEDFGPYSVLLDFSAGLENPGISYLGVALAEECGVRADELANLDEVPSRSLLSRITDHYMQILANQAPIGFEAEFVNQRGATILYRGILLPYSSDDDAIDFIYGVINWKELADAAASEELLLEIDQALEDSPLSRKGAAVSDGAGLADWADGPLDLPGKAELPAPAANDSDDVGLPAPSFGLRAVAEPTFAPERDEDDRDGDWVAVNDALPKDAYAGLDADAEVEEESAYEGAYESHDEYEDEDEDEDDPHAGLGRFASLVRPQATSDTMRVKAPLIPSALHTPEATVEDVLDTIASGTAEAGFEDDAGATVIELPIAAAPDPETGEGMELGDWLAAARECADEARSSEDRTRGALYEAVGRAYDFSLAAQDAPDDFAELLADSNIATQERAPMTPVVKLVFGADYDKTRLTEYAAALSHAHRLELPRGALAGFLRDAEGGLKGVVKAERRLRREESGAPALTAEEAREQLAEALRALAPQGFDALAGDGSEFALLMVRRLDDGRVVLLGEVPEDAALIERAARKLVG